MKNASFLTVCRSKRSARVLVVDRGLCVRILVDGHHYSMPPEYAGKRVSVTIADDKIYIYDLDSWRKITESKRCKNTQGNKTHLLPEPLIDAERKYRRQPREWVAEFVKAGLPEDFANRLVRHLKKRKNQLSLRPSLQCLNEALQALPGLRHLPGSEHSPRVLQRHLLRNAQKM